MRLIGLALILALSLSLAPLAVEAQPQTEKVWRIGGVLTSLYPPGADPPQAFRQGLRTLGGAAADREGLSDRSHCSRRRCRQHRGAQPSESECRGAPARIARSRLRVWQGLRDRATFCRRQDRTQCRSCRRVGETYRWTSYQRIRLGRGQVLSPT